MAYKKNRATTIIVMSIILSLFSNTLWAIITLNKADNLTDNFSLEYKGSAIEQQTFDFIFYNSVNAIVNIEVRIDILDINGVLLHECGEFRIDCERQKMTKASGKLFTVPERFYKDNNYFRITGICQGASNKLKDAHWSTKSLPTDINKLIYKFRDNEVIRSTSNINITINNLLSYREKNHISIWFAYDNGKLFLSLEDMPFQEGVFNDGVRLESNSNSESDYEPGFDPDSIYD